MKNFIYSFLFFPLLAYTIDLKYRFNPEDQHNYIKVLKATVLLGDSQEQHAIKLNMATQIHYQVENLIGPEEAIIRVKTNTLSAEIQTDEGVEPMVVEIPDMLQHLTSKGELKGTEILIPPSIRANDEEIHIQIIKNMLSQMGSFYPTQEVKFGVPWIQKEAVDMVGFKIVREKSSTLNQQNSKTWMILEDVTWAQEPIKQHFPSGCVSASFKDFEGENHSSSLISRSDGWPVVTMRRGIAKGIFYPYPADEDEGLNLLLEFEYTLLLDQEEETF